MLLLCQTGWRSRMMKRRNAWGYLGRRTRFAEELGTSERENLSRVVRERWNSEGIGENGEKLSRYRDEIRARARSSRLNYKITKSACISLSVSSLRELTNLIKLVGRCKLSLSLSLLLACSLSGPLLRRPFLNAEPLRHRGSRHLVKPGRDNART